jgi:2-dehydro-3-deoxyphosphogluconate aldolase/(4S)-4-hydroxy-2-oxoglutarate aldolase
MSLEQLREHKLIAIVRGVPPEYAMQTAEALLESGVRFLEVTLNSPNALETLKLWRKRFPKLHIGAGTVLSVKEANQALAVGAQYLISPHTDANIIQFARESNIAVYPGAYTPTEIVTAYNAGATAVKVFPVSSPSYIKDIRAPLNHIPLIAVGGVSAENAKAYLEAGAIALGVGSSLVNLELIRAEKFDELRARAISLVRTIRGEK